jgi:hypothetical protein
MRKNNFRNKESGVALLIALLALLLISAVGLGMVYMSSTETSINGNYKDTQTAFFAMRGGLEEMRDRMRSNSVQPVPALAFSLVPTAQPGAAANSIVYITNPSAPPDVVDPITFGTPYFDDEFCHESFVGSGVNYSPPGTPCNAAGAPPAAFVAPYVASQAPYTNTAASLKYKWARITMKQNGTFPNTPVDSTQAASSPVCWNAINNQEVAATALGYPDCATAQSNGLNVSPTYLITSMAITPQGSRRVGQYEVAAFNIAPPPSGLSLDGPAPIFNTPHSNNAAVNGHDGSASASGTVPPAVPGCATNPANSVPAIGADSSVDAASIPPQIFRPANFTGQGASPSVIDQGSDAGGSNQLSNWSTPTQLNNMAANIANGADQSFSCGINGVGGAGCSGTYGSVATPQITYINGDVNLTGGAGVLVVTGTLTISGAMQFDGLILVIGQGNVVISGGGAGEIFGQLFVAKTNSSVSPFPQLATLASPTFTWNGGGKASITYNSCWAGIGNKMHYTVVASREEMY